MLGRIPCYTVCRIQCDEADSNLIGCSLNRNLFSRHQCWHWLISSAYMTVCQQQTFYSCSSIQSELQVYVVVRTLLHYRSILTTWHACSPLPCFFILGLTVLSYSIWTILTWPPLASYCNNNFYFISRVATTPFPGNSFLLLELNHSVL